MSSPGRSSADEQADAVPDWLEHGSCEEIFSYKENREAARSYLRTHGVKVPSGASTSEICGALSQAVARVELSGCDHKDEVRLSGACVHVREAQKALDAKPTRFSAQSRRRIKVAGKRRNAANHPCYISSGNVGACSENPDCSYHKREGLYGMLFAAARDHGECYVKESVVDRAKAGKLDEPQTMRVLRDLMFDNIAKESARFPPVNAEAAQVSNQLMREKLRSDEREIRSMPKEEMVKFIGIITAPRERNLPSMTAGLLMLVKLTGAAARYASYITLKMVARIGEFVGVRMRGETLEWVQALLMLAMFAVENSLPWTAWLLLTPWGRQSLGRMLRDPKYAATFLVMMVISGDSGDPVLDFLPDVSSLIDLGHVETLVEQVASRLVGWAEANPDDREYPKRAKDLQRALRGDRKRKSHRGHRGKRR